MTDGTGFAIAGAPPPGTPVPAVVRRLLGPGATPVWRNELGGLTYRTAGLVAKWQPAGRLDLRQEAERLMWASRHAAVPVPLEAGADDDGSWLLTAALPGRSAVDPRWLADPATASRAIGAGLRALHDALPVRECPFSWDAQGRAERARRLGRRDPAQRHPDMRDLDFDEVIAMLQQPPLPDRLVVCTGDACAPNTLVDDGGNCSGHVDLGMLGVADRWADLAVATWSTQWNYGPGWEGALLDAYGIEPDPERTRYYRLLWEFSP